MLADGLTDLPPGKIAAIVTYLELRAPPPPRPAPTGAWRLAPIGGDPARYRRLFRGVGEPWLWSSRLRIGDAALRAILDDPAVAALALCDGAGEIGLLELDFRVPGECELAFLGVVPPAIGTGAGRFLMSAAIERAFAQPIARLWVHTCTLDHPGALAFYLRSGFRPYRRAIEIADDPRLTGHLPPDAAPHVPLVAPPAAAS